LMRHINLSSSACLVIIIHHGIHGLEHLFFN
jgi:hypothetical protein